MRLPHLGYDLGKGQTGDGTSNELLLTVIISILIPLGSLILVQVRAPNFR